MLIGVNNFQLTSNFNLSEFECKHCGAVKLHPRLLEKLQALRELLGVPLWFTSAYRCEIHNKAEKGAKNSQHLTGRAVDIPVHITGLTYSQLLDLVKWLGFTGIGVNEAKGFIHVDVREGNKQVLFDY